jgi:hypothetical protein
VAYWLRDRTWIILSAAIFSALIIAGQIVGHGALGTMAVLNRVIALVTLWVVAQLLIRLKRSP